MAGFIPLPPSVLHSAVQLTHAQAHAHLSAFLENAENDAAYRPDSTLTERGPQSTSTGGQPNLTLHHLRRILQGIEGKRLGGEDIGRFFGEGARLTQASRKRRVEDEKDDGTTKRLQVEERREDDKINDPNAVVGREQDSWQDKEDYEHAEQDDEVNAMAQKRHPGAHLREPVNAEEAERSAAIEIEGTGQKVGLSQQRAETSLSDKQARKEAKKQRMKEMKREKEDMKAKK